MVSCLRLGNLLIHSGPDVEKLWSPNGVDSPRYDWSVDPGQRQSFDDCNLSMKSPTAASEVMVLKWQKKWWGVSTPQGFGWVFGILDSMFLLRSRNAVSTDVQKGILPVPPFLKANLSRKTSSHVHPIFPYLSSNPRQQKLCLQKCHFSTSHFWFTPKLQGGSCESWHQLKQSTIFGEFHQKPPFKITTTQHTCILFLSFDLPPQDIDIPHFYQ